MIGKSANQITGEILIALSQRYGRQCIAFRANVITARAARGTVKSLPAGCADILGTALGLPLAIEVKAGRDRLRPAQRAFAEAWTRAGGVYIEARDVDAALAELAVRITGRDLARCDMEMSAAEAEIRAGGEDCRNLLLWLGDWSYERKLIEKERK